MSKKTIEEMIEDMENVIGYVKISKEDKVGLAEVITVAKEGFEKQEDPSYKRVIEACALLSDTIERTKDEDDMEVSMTELALIDSIAVLMGQESQLRNPKPITRAEMNHSEGSETIH